jgi:8-oxo-dGTP pyrophosphatase MutT (NUDIX family)
MDADPQAHAPGGRPDPVESPWRTLAARRVYSNPWLSLTEYEVLAAAQRELAEEAGVEATEWLPLGTYDLSPGIMTQVSHIFLARGLRAVTARPEGTERFTLRALPLREALDACLRGELRSAVTVLGIWRAWAYLHGIG